jgi:hypothetical protein
MTRLHPLERAERLFLVENRHTLRQEQILHDLILGARSVELSLTHQTFQELVLGSVEFARTYSLPAFLNCESYLLLNDQSNLSLTESARLKDWMGIPGQAAAVITSRPSRPPAGVFSTPEAELGAELVGLDAVPILGWGGMCWLGLQCHTDPQTFLKPSPVHALAALRMARGENQETALFEAAELVETGSVRPGWTDFEGAKIYIFEDTPTGIISVQAAREVLGKAGIRIEPKSYGITRNQVKARALEALGAHIFLSLMEALEMAIKSTPK